MLQQGKEHCHWASPLHGDYFEGNTLQSEWEIVLCYSIYIILPHPFFFIII
jgi:hypothetical protein